MNVEGAAKQVATAFKKETAATKKEYLECKTASCVLRKEKKQITNHANACSGELTMLRDAHVDEDDWEFIVGLPPREVHVTLKVKSIEDGAEQQARKDAVINMKENKNAARDFLTAMMSGVVQNAARNLHDTAAVALQKYYHLGGMKHNDYTPAKYASIDAVNQVCVLHVVV